MCIIQLSHFYSEVPDSRSSDLAWLTVLEGLALGHLVPSTWAEPQSTESVVEESSSPGRGRGSAGPWLVFSALL